MRWVGSVLLCVAAAAPCASQSLASLVAEAEQRGARTGVVIQDGDRQLYAHRAGETFAPASNQKLLTAAAVLHALGVGYEFRTRFRLEAGELVVTAGGDPNWESGSGFDPARLLAPVVAELQRAQLRTLRGVRTEPGRFTGPARPSDWPADQLEREYCAPTSGLLVDASCFTASVRAPASGSAVVSEIVPDVFTLRGGIDVKPKGRALWGLRDSGDGLVAFGAIRPNAGPLTVRAAVRDPELVFRRLVERELQRAGIGLDPTAAAPADHALPDVATPLTPALRRMLVDSSNVHAEQLARVLGAELAEDGTLRGGVAELRRQVDGIVPLDAGCVLTDASGLSRSNRVTPRVLAAVLRHALASPWGNTWLQALPAAGQEGTLRERFGDAAELAALVRAKTGYIAGASALSGYVALADGRQRAFVILMNFDARKPIPNRELKLLQERIVAAAAELGG